MNQELCTALCNTLKPFAERVEKHIKDAFFAGFMAGMAVMLLIVCFTS